MQNVALAFFVSFGLACKQQLIGNFLIVMAIFRLCFPLCDRPVLFISLSFCLLSFIFALSFLQLFLVEVANLCAKVGCFLRAKRVWPKKFPGASPPDPLLSPFSPRP